MVLDMFYILANTAFQALVMGFVYAALALGYNVVYRVSKAINLAEPELVVFTAYVAFVALAYYNIPIPVAFISSLIVGFSVGVVLERLLARPLRGRPVVALMAATLGAYYVLRGTSMIISRGFEMGSLGVPESYYSIGAIRASLSDFMAMGISLFVIAGVVLMHRFTRLGIAMRAVSEDAFGASAYGLPVRSLTMLSWGIAGAVSAAAALALAAKAQVGPTLDFYALKALAASLLAGLDSVAGVVVGGLVLGFVEQFGSLVLDPIFPGLGSQLAFIVMLVVLLVKPYGIFGSERIERV
ncbi:MAG TPA: branched-chain amino acid ABC transporter permease [Pyrodictium sp.]|nr:branched-chain amino acid ABC transporter permease [Pyrodictium sp.]